MGFGKCVMRLDTEKKVFQNNKLTTLHLQLFEKGIQKIFEIVTLQKKTCLDDRTII